MKKIINVIQYVLPFKSKFKNILLYLSLSPIINCGLTNVYYYNCGGYIQNVFDIIGLINPFNSCNYLCFILSVCISMNLYLKSYIFYIMLLFIFSLFI